MKNTLNVNLNCALEENNLANPLNNAGKNTVQNIRAKNTANIIAN